MLTMTSLAVVRGAPPHADLVFLSTDSNGMVGELKRYKLQSLQLPPMILPRDGELSKGFAIRPTKQATLVFVLAMSGAPIDARLTASLSHALAELPISENTRLRLPLMATGKGGLSDLASLAAILDAIEASPILRSHAAKITIAAPDNLSGSEVAALQAFAKGRTAYFTSPNDDGSSRIARADSAFPRPDDRVYGADVEALFLVAKSLSSRRIAPSNHLSTTLLLFAITRADRPDAPTALAASAVGGVGC